VSAAATIRELGGPLRLDRYFCKETDSQGFHMPLEAELTVVGETSGRWRTRLSDERERRDTPAVLQELSSTEFSWTFMDHEGTAFPITVEWLLHKKDYVPLAAVRKRKRIDRLMPPSFLKLTTRISYSDEYINRHLRPRSADPSAPDISREDLVTIIQDTSVRDFGGVLTEILLAANIARPASLDFNASYLFIDSKFIENGRGGPSDLRSAVDNAADRGWPHFGQMEIHTVMRWLARVPGFRARHAESPLGRALAAASYLFWPSWGQTDHLALVWALLGLEALYTRGNAGLQEQLASKTTAFLGNRTSHKKNLPNMYNFRSRFIHGDLDFPYAYNEADASPEYERFNSDRFASENIAVAMLFSTLQRMCLENRFELSFHHAVSSPGSSTA
jgi:hypothetical protein